MSEKVSDGDPKPAGTLRERAEEFACAPPIETARIPDVRRLIQELEIQRRELEIRSEDLRAAQVETAELRNRYLDLYEFAPVGYVTLSVDGKVLGANLKAAAMLDVQRQDLVGANFSNFVSRAFQNDSWLHRQKVFSSQIKQTSELEMQTADGATLWVRLESLAYGAQQERRCQTSLVDVSELKRVEQSLRESEERYALVARMSLAGLWAYDFTRDTVTRDETYDRLYGPPPADAAGAWQWWIERIDNGDRGRVVESIREALAGTTEEWREHYRFRKADGSYADLLDMATIVRDEAGKAKRILGAVLDITERKAAEDAIRASEARLQGLLDNTIAVVYLKDREGRYLTINRRFEEIFRLTAEQIIGHTDDDVHPPEIVKQLRENDMLVMETGRPLEFEEVVNHYDGPRTYISVKFPIFDAAARVTAVGGISTDITERKQASDLLRAESELLRSTIEFQDRERRLVAYDIHDGMLQDAAGALMHLEALGENLESRSVVNEVANISGLVRKFLAEGRRIMNGIRTPVLDDAGVIGAIQQLIDEEERAHCPIEFVWGKDFGRLSAKTEGALYRIAQEGLTNALKHSQTKQIQIQLERRGDRAHLEIRDWGVGFDPLHPDTGVHGLRGMSERAKIAGGSCSIESKLGQGTRISVDLPYVGHVDS